jgi:hypothetical protein
MSAFNRRSAIKSVLTSAVVPSVVTGCAISPAAAAICNAAPYVPARLNVAVGGGPDAELLELCAQFHRINDEENAAFERFCALPEDCHEAKAMAAGFDERYPAWNALADACYEAAPKTPEGAAAVLDVVFARDSEHIEEAAQKALRHLRDCLNAMGRA